MLRPEELAALGLSEATVEEAIRDGQSVKGTIVSGTQTSRLWLFDFGARLRELTGLEMKPGSVNLCAHHPTRLPSPVRVEASGAFRGIPGYFCPVIIEGAALGFAMRTERGSEKSFVEIFAHTWIRERLGLEIGEPCTVVLLPGSDYLE